MGRWLKTNGEAIYGTDGGDVSCGESVVSTRGKDGVLYLHFVDPTVNRLVFTPERELVEATCLATGEQVRQERTPSGDVVVSIDRPAEDAFARVVRVRYR